MSRTITSLNNTFPEWHCCLLASTHISHSVTRCYITHIPCALFSSRMVFSIRMLKRPLGKWSNISKFDTMMLLSVYGANVGPKSYNFITIIIIIILKTRPRTGERVHNMVQKLVVVFVMNTMGQVSFTLIAINALPFRHQPKPEEKTSANIFRTKKRKVVKI